MSFLEKNPFEYVLNNCMESTRNNILVIYDATTQCFLDMIKAAGKASQKNIIFVEIEVGECHGIEPESYVLDQMMKSELVMCITKYSLAHTLARKKITEMRIPFLSMPDYNWQMLKNGAHFVNYRKKYLSVKKYADILSNGSEVRIFSDNGTDLKLNIKGRKGNCCPGMVNDEYLLGSPPDIEANIAPIEDKSNGILVVDGSITDSQIGLLDSPMKLRICNGKIIEFSSRNYQNVRIAKQIFANVKSDKAYYIGELGMGFNDLGMICGNMLVDEGAKGCIHFGMGSNWTIGGKNKVSFHLDFVMKEATVLVDNVKIIERGAMIYE